MSGDPGNLNRFRFLASYLASRTLQVSATAAGEPAYTDGQVVFVSGDVSPADQRRQVVVQAALIGAGSLDAELVKGLRGRQKVARRYLALESRRVLADLVGSVPIVAALDAHGEPTTISAAESLDVAYSRQQVAEPLEWFGVIKPSCLLSRGARQTVAPTDHDLHVKPKLRMKEAAEAEEDTDQGEESSIRNLLRNTLIPGSSSLMNFLFKMIGGSPSPVGGAAGSEMPVGSVRRVTSVGPNARPLPVPLRFADHDAPGIAGGVDGALYPEWDVDRNRYRPQWCRAIEVALPPRSEVSAGGVDHDDVLRRRLARVALGPKGVRRQPDGQDLDLDALIDLAVDLQAGFSPREDIYLEQRKLARNLGVLILLDASGSATEKDPTGLSVYEHQRRATATLASTLEQLGDRVAVYGFRSHGRAAVHLLPLKPFGRRFGLGGRAQLNQLEPAGYTRLGAAIRHGGELLKADAGTPNRLLVLISDGFPYDDGYESHYAEADVRKALEELRTDGLGCLCLSIGASTPTDALDRVFGSASHANAATLAELSPRMDELFLGALKELAVAQSRR